MEPQITLAQKQSKVIVEDTVVRQWFVVILVQEWSRTQH